MNNFVDWDEGIEGVIEPAKVKTNISKGDLKLAEIHLNSGELLVDTKDGSIKTLKGEKLELIGTYDAQILVKPPLSAWQAIRAESVDIYLSPHRLVALGSTSKSEIIAYAIGSAFDNVKEGYCSWFNVRLPKYQLTTSPLVIKKRRFGKPYAEICAISTKIKSRKQKELRKLQLPPDAESLADKINTQIIAARNRDPITPKIYVTQLEL